MEALVLFGAFVLPIAGVAGAVALALRWPRRLTRVGLAAVLALAALDLVAWAAVGTDFRDADGFIDCWPYCTPLQEAVGMAVSWSPILTAALAGLEAVYLFVRSRRRAPRGAE